MGVCKWSSRHSAKGSRKGDGGGGVEEAECLVAACCGTLHSEGGKTRELQPHSFVVPEQNSETRMTARILK